MGWEIGVGLEVNNLFRSTLNNGEGFITTWKAGGPSSQHCNNTDVNLFSLFQFSELSAGAFFIDMRQMKMRPLEARCREFLRWQGIIETRIGTYFGLEISDRGGTKRKEAV